MKKESVIHGLLLLTTVFFSATLCASDMARTDRYTLVAMEAGSDQSRPLSAITHVSMGRDVSSVGDAIKELLKGSGYHWQSKGSGDLILNTLPLPSVARDLGPLRLSDALQTLAGEAWLLQTDNLHRVVWFELNSQASMATTTRE